MTGSILRASAQAPSGREEPGAIKGRVVNERGQAVPQATVYYVSEGRTGPGIRPTVTADSEGNFAFDEVEPGLYRICALKDEADYPDTNRTFYDAYVPYPTVTVYPGQATKDVVIRLGPKGARIWGRVSDALTGLPIREAGITFYAAVSSQVYMGTTVGRQADFNILVPSTKTFRMRVHAPGYETWYYGPDGTEQHAQPIRMAAGARKELVIRLQPVRK